MFIIISDAFDDATLSSLRATLAELEFEPGRRTAGWHAREVKSNRQAKASPARRHVERLVLERLAASPLLAQAALPARFAPPLFSRAGVGEGYGRHVDDALIGSPPLRSDLSLTLFLSDPDSYEGGELVIETDEGESAFKLPAGQILLYPSGTLHRVETVRAGERLAAVTWIESRVRDAAAREMLFDLDRAMRSLHAREGRSEAFDLIAKTRANLLRRWAGA